MSQRSEWLLRSLSELPDSRVEEADQEEHRKNRRSWKRYALLAACLALVVTGAGILTGQFPQMGGSAGGAGVNLTSEAPSYTYYAGPILPLSVEKPSEAIQAERTVTLDFAPWIPEETPDETERSSPVTKEEREGDQWTGFHSILVTDTYTLINSSSQPQTVTALYPFPCKPQNLEQFAPSLTLDGQPLETEILPGQISSEIVKDDPNTGTRVVTPDGSGVYYPDTWKDFAALLEDGSYQQQAIAPKSFSGSCTVYDIALQGEPAQSGRVQVRCSLDYEKTRVYHLGARGISWDPEGGTLELDGETAIRLVVLGEDIQNVEVEYRVLEEDQWVPTGETVSMERREADAGEALQAAAREVYRTFRDGNVSFPLFHAIFLDTLEAAWQYDGGTLSAGMLLNLSRVFYLKAEISIPAGGSVRLTALQEKEGSHDFSCQKTRYRGTEGYDLATRMGSLLTIGEQHAVLEDRDQIEIVAQNFGFDLEQGIREVSLTEDAYWLVVRTRKS